MARCETCGNEYDKCFDVVVGATRHTFDCFECAMYLLAPCCARCNVRIIGHGVESNDVFFCCAHCAQQSGVNARDREDRPTTIAAGA